MLTTNPALSTARLAETIRATATYTHLPVDGPGAETCESWVFTIGEHTCEVKAWLRGGRPIIANPYHAIVDGRHLAGSRSRSSGRRSPRRFGHVETAIKAILNQIAEVK